MRHYKKTRVSVVVPALNEERYIGPALDALARQTLPRGSYEVIVADARSEDRTREIAKRCADRVVSAERGSAAISRNTGARAARSDILVFVDADTIAPADLLERVLARMANPSVMGGTCALAPLSQRARYRLAYGVATRAMRFSINRLGWALCTGTCCFFRRSVFDAEGGFRVGRISEDHDLARRVSRRGRFVYLGGAPALTSARRFEEWGYLRLLLFYVKELAKDVLRRPAAREADYWAAR